MDNLINKKALTSFGLHPLLENRWSPNAFRDEKIPREKLVSIFDAARWSPSSANEQAWRFIIGEKGSATFDKIAASLTGNNKLWAPNAPVLIVSLAKKYYQRNNSDYFHGIYDTGQAVAHLSIQAMHEGLFVHQMGGFLPDMLREAFGVPEEFHIVTVIAVGYHGNPESLPEVLKEREFAERKRLPLSEIVFSESFGKSWEI